MNLRVRDVISADVIHLLIEEDSPRGVNDVDASHCAEC